MMSIDRAALAEFLEHLVDRYYGHELILKLEELGVITVRDVIARFEDELIEARKEFED